VGIVFGQLLDPAALNPLQRHNRVVMDSSSATYLLDVPRWVGQDGAVSLHT
jgi:hypothetical protein